MKILVTGGTGFTGSHLCERLVAQGHRVRALVRKKSRQDFLAGLGVERFEGDLSDPDSIDSAVQGIDTVYHIAALYRQQGVDHKMFRKINTEGVDHIFKASLVNGVKRIVHCSTVGVHGHIAHPPANEETPYAPGDIYQITKLDGEKIAKRYMEEGKIAVTIFRPTAIYGPRDLRFLKLFRMIKKRRFLMLGEGNVTYHMIYISDLIDGIIKCGTDDHAIGKIFILGGERYITLNELVGLIADELRVPRPRWHFPLWPVYAAGFFCEKVCKPLGIEPPLYRRRIDFFKKSRAFDVSKSHKEINFKAKTNLAAGLKKTASWYIEQGYLQ